MNNIETRPWTKWEIAGHIAVPLVMAAVVYGMGVWVDAMPEEKIENDPFSGVFFGLLYIAPYIVGLVACLSFFRLAFMQPPRTVKRSKQQRNELENQYLFSLPKQTQRRIVGCMVTGVVAGIGVAATVGATYMDWLSLGWGLVLSLVFGATMVTAFTFVDHWVNRAEAYAKSPGAGNGEASGNDMSRTNAGDVS